MLLAVNKPLAQSTSMPWCAAFLWGSIAFSIALLAIWPNPIQMVGYADKFVHSTSCMLLMLFPAFYFKGSKRITALAVVLVCAGFAIEAVQYFMPEREASVGDVLANLSGVVLGIIAGKLMRNGYYKTSL